MANPNKFPTYLSRFVTILFMDILEVWCQTARIYEYKGKLP